MKLENLVAVTSLSSTYVGELVVSVRVAYEVREGIEVSLKGWLNAGFAGNPDDKQTAVSAEPEVVLRFGPVKPYLGVVVPVLGPPRDAAFFGARIGVAAAF